MKPTDESIDEVALAVDGAREAYARVGRELRPDRTGGLRRMTQNAERVMRELGVTFTLYRDDAAGGRDHIVPFDPYPRIIGPQEWEIISRGIEQRLQVWNAFFSDIYSTQEVLRAEVIPFQAVYDDPNYQRAAVGVKVPERTHAHVAAFDLARDSTGNWMVVEDYVANTTGASYALQSRHVLTQACPELLDGHDILPIHGYATDLLEHLRRFAPAGPSEPRVVLLSPGVYNHAHYDHSYLARQMGIPLVRGNDLIVLNTRVYLKTIGGLEPIDVIYRRMDEAFLDPLAFRGDSQLGVAGLMTCVRKGTVAVINAVGAGLGDNRAISSFLGRLSRFYFNEPLALASAPRSWCADRDECELVLGGLRDYTIAATSERSDQSTWDASRMDADELDRLRRRITAQPANYVARKLLPAMSMPAVIGEKILTRHTGLRVFAFGGPSARVYPCALTRFALDPGSTTISSGLGGGVKDTWVLRGNQPAPAEAPIIVASAQRRLRLGSRIADSLFWMGRYIERAENTTRILRVLQLIGLENQSAPTSVGWRPFWEALARATGHPTHFFKNHAQKKHQDLARYILLDRKNQASVHACVELCRSNAQATRESIPPEVWVLINRLHLLMHQASESGQGELSQMLGLEEEVLNQIDTLAGCAGKSMLRDDSWHFWIVGLYLERALTTLLVMQQIFIKWQGEDPSHRRRETNLDALLRMLSCQYAYRSLYQARPTPDNAARMLLQDPQLPRSVLFCLQTVRGSLRALMGDTSRDFAGVTPLKICAQLAGEIEFTDLSPFFAKPFRRQKLRATLDSLIEKVTHLSTAISDHYLYHQAFNVLR